MGLIDDVPTCEELITTMVKEAEEALKSGPSYITEA
jgi:hypothetical protein